jgi:hypothetical protein
VARAVGYPPVCQQLKRLLHRSAATHIHAAAQQHIKFSQAAWQSGPVVRCSSSGSSDDCSHHSARGSCTDLQSNTHTVSCGCESGTKGLSLVRLVTRQSANNSSTFCTDLQPHTGQHAGSSYHTCMQPAHFELVFIAFEAGMHPFSQLQTSPEHRSCTPLQHIMCKMCRQQPPRAHSAFQGLWYA